MIKIVSFRETSKQESVPQSSYFGGKDVYDFKIDYGENVDDSTPWK